MYEEIATIHGSDIQFTEIEWLPCVSFLALLASLLPLVLYCFVLLIVEKYICLSRKRAKLGIEGCVLLGTEDRRKVQTKFPVSFEFYMSRAFKRYLACQVPGEIPHHLCRNTLKIVLITARCLQEGGTFPWKPIYVFLSLTTIQ